QRYTERPYSTIEVKAYSNAERASLTLNGQAIGEVACPDRVCLWPSVRLAPGANQAVVTATVGGKELRDEASWTGPDPAQGLRLDAGDIASHGVGGRLFGSDTFVTGGTALALNTPAFGTRRAPQKTVSGDSPELYEYWREGAAFSYAIPLPDGRWTITVHTFEPGEKTSLLNARSEPKPRLRANMTILANGRPAVPAFNVATAAGGELRGLAKSFPVTVRGGTLRLDFRGAKGGTALVAAIEVSR
ncbi:MAG: malectin domain-containing carbohydrate-binding protein, partial [Novosphingobium sp.]